MTANRHIKSDCAVYSQFLWLGAPHRVEQKVTTVDSTAPTGTGKDRNARHRKGFLLVVIFMFFASPGWAALVSEPMQFEQLLADIHERLNQIDIADDRFPCHDLLADSCDDADIMASGADIIRAASVHTSKISGLQLKGAYGTGTLTENSDDDSDFEGGRGNLELSRDILKQGYRQDAMRAKAQELVIVRMMSSRGYAFAYRYTSVKTICWNSNSIGRKEKKPEFSHRE